ncbi:MAG: cyclodeaminase/cyclohydrolase family protein [Thermoplasmata archaeon]
MIVDQRINEFLADLSSSSPAPGGGAASALVASIAASLTAMVANLTIGKKKYLAVEPEMKKIVTEAITLRDFLTQLMDRDVEEFNMIMAAYKLPKETVQEKELRDKKIEEASIRASNVPLETARACVKIMDLALKVIKSGNINAVSDGICSFQFANSAMKGALANVKINLNNISNQEILQQFNTEIENIEKESINMYERNKELLEKVK